jgi:hypothetical protein
MMLRKTNILFLSLGLLIIGTAGYFLSPRGLPLFYVFAHLGALGVMGLFGSLAGVLARKKHRDYWLAFSFGALLPIITGGVAVLIFWLGKEGQLYCGGSISLAVAVLIVVFYLLIKNKSQSQTKSPGNISID